MMLADQSTLMETSSPLEVLSLLWQLAQRSRSAKVVCMGWLRADCAREAGGSARRAKATSRTRDDENVLQALPPTLIRINPSGLATGGFRRADAGFTAKLFTFEQFFDPSGGRMDAGPVRRNERGRTAFMGEARPESADRARAATLPAERWLMNVLLVYPEFPETFWSFKHALKFLGKRAAQPPLGLMTVAALLPRGVEEAAGGHECGAAARSRPEVGRRGAS